MKSQGYNPWNYYHTNPHLQVTLEQIASGYFSRSEPRLFKPLLDSLLNRDEYMLLADYQSYVDCQAQVSQAYQNQEHWTRMSILNTARAGKFSSDRAIHDYCQEIWHAEPVKIELEE